MKSFPSIIFTILLSFLICSCDTSTGDSRYADIVVSAPGASDIGFGDSTHAVDGVHGGGCTGQNATDIYSLSNNPANENISITLRWSGRRAANGEGTDFAVFENPFDSGTCGSGTRFMDQLIVSLSIDGIEWIDFPHEYSFIDDPSNGPAINEKTYSKNPVDWTGFAGVTPVLFNEKTNPVDPFSADEAGGDHFDLDDIPDTALGTQIKNKGFVYIKLTAAATVINSDTAENFVHDSYADGPDVDGVYAKYLEEE